MKSSPRPFFFFSLELNFFLPCSLWTHQIAGNGLSRQLLLPSAPSSIIISSHRTQNPHENRPTAILKSRTIIALLRTSQSRRRDLASSSHSRGAPRGRRRTRGGRADTQMAFSLFDPSTSIFVSSSRSRKQDELTSPFLPRTLLP